MAFSATLIQPARTAHAKVAPGTLAFAAALGGAETAYHLAGPLWGAVCFAVIFIAVINLALLAAARLPAEHDLMVLIVAASMVPLGRLIVLSVPTLPALRLYPNALWVIPLGMTTTYAYRTGWVTWLRRPLLGTLSPGRRTLALQGAVTVTGAGLGVLAAYTLPYDGPHVLVYADAAKWTGAVLFALAGAAEELAWRGVLQRSADAVLGRIGIALCFVASAYIAVAWMGLSTAVPVIVMSGVTSVVVYRTRSLTGAVSGHFLLNLLLVMLR